MGNLAKRVLTAAVLVPALLAALYVDVTPWSILAFAIVAAGIGYDEYLRMALPVGMDDRAIGLRLTAVLSGGLVMAAMAVLGLRWTVPAITLAAVVLAAVVLFRRDQLEQAGRHVGIALSGLVYVPVLFSLLPMLKDSPVAEGPHWLTVTLCLAFFSDTVAYAFGRMFGRHKLYPAVSPKKTWAGGVGGLVGGVLATAGVGSSWLVPDLPIAHAVVLGIAGSICGQIGDLVASMLKRTYGVKDSGTLLPGHGGMLDRIDGLLFVGPVVFFYRFVLSA